jgi:hypothetical protein
MDTTRQAPFKRIAFIGNYLPRQCGIATFTTDLCEAVAAQYPETTCFALPVNDTDTGYAYPPRVRFELAESDAASYRRAADFLNGNNVDLVCLQHEYGIFGGPAGSHILALLRELRMPVVTTLGIGQVSGTVPSWDRFQTPDLPHLHLPPLAGIGSRHLHLRLQEFMED